jgi:hypothetical protein
LPASIAAMLMLFFLADSVVRTSAVAAPVRPRATVRILRPAPASADQWKEAPAERRREVIRKSADGRIELLRIIEHP